jgi:hypothetical protein
MKKITKRRLKNLFPVGSKVRVEVRNHATLTEPELYPTQEYRIIVEYGENHLRTSRECLDSESEDQMETRLTTWNTCVMYEDDGVVFFKNLSSDGKVDQKPFLTMWEAKEDQFSNLLKNILLN